MAVELLSKSGVVVAGRVDFEDELQSLQGGVECKVVRSSLVS